MRKALPAVLLVASCVGCKNGPLEPETIYEDALGRIQKETDEDRKLGILDEAIGQLGHYSYAFKLREVADRIWAQRERRLCTRSDAGREKYVALLPRLHALKPEDDPREFAAEVRGFVNAHKDTDLAFDLRLCYRRKLLDHLEHVEQKPIPWGVELPKTFSPEEEGKLSRREEARVLAESALAKIGASPASHSMNIRQLSRALARVRELDPVSPYLKALEEAMAEEKKVIDKQRTRRAEKAMTEAVNRAEDRGPRALVQELEAIREQVAETQVEPLWREHLSDARRKLAGEAERKRREEKASAVAKAAVARAGKCGLDYEEARDILRSAIDEVKGTKAERALRRELKGVEKKTPERLNAKAQKLLGKRDIDGAIAVLREIVRQEEFTKRVDYSGSLAFQIGATLAREFSAYSPGVAQKRGFASTHDEAVHYYILAASRNSETDRGLLEAAGLLLEMKLPGRARRCLEEARGSSQLNVRNEAERRLRELDARPEG